mmetsp:Transcript_11911/g.22848  ORF Transcript_11911/g.22848 Transcript_11911/m.22848 type:complete len:315 (+) Transcript_11911:478-1422(+)
MDQLTEDDVMDGKITYATIFTVINFLTFFGFLRHLRFCLRSETYAKQTSLIFLGMNACIDLFLSLWHLRLALYYYTCFDYLMLTSIWSFTVFIIVQSRLVRVVWRAQNQSVVDFGVAYERRVYGIFNTRFFIITTTIVLAAIAIDNWYMLTIAALHCFFVPQIIKNVTNNHKDALKPSVYLSISAGRLALILYIFGCPANFLIWRPKYWFVWTMTAIIVLQIAMMGLQRVCGPRFILPQRFKPRVYSYYKPMNDELELTDQSDCSICLTQIEKDNTQVMTTPCNHHFHKDCLTHWMTIKLQCPTCRAELPSVEE